MPGQPENSGWAWVELSGVDEKGVCLCDLFDDEDLIFNLLH